MSKRLMAELEVPKCRRELVPTLAACKCCWAETELSGLIEGEAAEILLVVAAGRRQAALAKDRTDFIL